MMVASPGAVYISAAIFVIGGTVSVVTGSPELEAAVGAIAYIVLLLSIVP